MEYPVTSYRTARDIVMDILSSIIGHTKKTHIMYRAKLNHRQLQAYLPKLVSCGLLGYDVGNRCYQRTAKGQRYRLTYRECERLEDEIERHQTALATQRRRLRDVVHAS